MNFPETSKLLDTLKPYISNAKIQIRTEGKDWKNRSYQSDFVMIDEKNNVGFEVFENEIIVFYFTDHHHFEDHTSELASDDDDYIARAEAFLLELFQYQLRHVEFYRGNALSSEKYYILYRDERADKYIGSTWYGLSRFINPFKKKQIKSTTWLFDHAKGCFTTRQPKNPHPEAIEVLDISEDCYIEIMHSHNTYTYSVMELAFDDYYGMYYWAPASNIIPSGFYDTKESAVHCALEAWKHKGCQ